MSYMMLNGRKVPYMEFPQTKWCCGGCGQDVYRKREYGYMLHKHVWTSAVRRAQSRHCPISTYDLLCVGCFEECLGRKLQRDDFNWSIPLNSTDSFPRSKRLLERMQV